MKRVIYIGRWAAEAAKPTPLDNAAIISINSDNKLAVLNEGWKHTLYTVFADIDSKMGDAIRFAYPDLILFNTDHAKAVIDFVEEVKDDINILVVHCDAGVSRSAAVAKFIAEKYKLPFSKDYSLYNKHVYRVLWNLENGYADSEEVYKS